MSNNIEENTPILLKEKHPPREKKLKYHVLFFILSLLLFLFIFMLLKIGTDILPFAMFILFFSFPIIVLFSKHLKEVIPPRLAKLLTEDVDEINNTGSSNFFSTEGKVSNRNKQYILIAFLVVIGITLIQLLRSLSSEVDPLSNIPADRKTTIKIVMAVTLTIFACVMTQNFYEISEDYTSI